MIADDKLRIMPRAKKTLKVGDQNPIVELKKMTDETKIASLG